MTISVVVMIIIGLILIFASYFISEGLTKKEENFNADLLTVNEDYEFSERERNIIKRKIEDVIAQQAKDILYETNESLSNMANEKTLALGDYAVAVCDEIERNHKEVMFLYSMLEDKQKEIMQIVQSVDKAKSEWKDTLMSVEIHRENMKRIEDEVSIRKPSAIDQLTALKQRKEVMDTEEKAEAVSKAHLESLDFSVQPEKQETGPELSEIDSNEEILEKAEENESNRQEDTTADTEEDTVLDEIVEEFVADTDIDMDDTTLVEEDISELDDIFDELDEGDLDETLEEEFKKSGNSNDIILEMYRNGDNIITIAKELGLGVGEVKLVIDLYQGE
jgi:hypothetical protein